MFILFSNLPIKIRLKIWATASNQEPRNIDIWTDFEKCEIGSTILYAQFYKCLLADLKPPAVLQTSRESRKEAKNHYDLEFRTEFALHDQVSVIHCARFYVNYATDMFIPRGHWNMVSLCDFFERCNGRLGHIAIDVTGRFWSEIVHNQLKTGQWWLQDTKGIVLYDSSKIQMFKSSGQLNEFKKQHNGGRRDLHFVKVQDPGEDLAIARVMLEIYSTKRIVCTNPEVEKTENDDETACIEDSILAAPRPHVQMLEMVVTQPIR